MKMLVTAAVIAVFAGGFAHAANPEAGKEKSRPCAACHGPDGNSTAADFPRLGKGDAPVLLFTGQMDYAPNAEAVAWFAHKVLPLVPGARFVIAGRSPPAAVRALAGARVTVTGAVPDMRSWLAAADVVVAPLKLARGIQNKVLEAMAMARPVVASPAAFEGIDAVAGRDLLVAEDAAGTAAAVNRLLADPGAIGSAARRRMELHYRWEARLAPLAAMVDPAQPRRAA